MQSDSDISGCCTVTQSSGMYESRAEDVERDASGCAPAVRQADSHHHRRRGGLVRQGSVVERLSKYGMRVMPSSFRRGQRKDTEAPAPGGLRREDPERASLTPAMRRKNLKELLLSQPSHSGFSSVLSTPSSFSISVSSEQGASDWALNPMEHAWMLAAAEGNYENLLGFLSAEPHLLSKRDFITGYSVWHWLAKRGEDESMLKLLSYAGRAGIPADVNVRGSGGLTPLHVASMHRRYAVVKMLVGAFGANVDAMDYSGRRAWQYLAEDAPLEMKELLGMWDDEHRGGSALNSNSNNSRGGGSSGSSMDLGIGDEPDHGHSHQVNSFDRPQRTSNWMFGSLKKLLPTFSFPGSRN